MGSGEVICSVTRAQDTLEENPGAIKCESGNVEAQWNNIWKCVGYC
jgi:hypothetical protein